MGDILNLNKSEPSQEHEHICSHCALKQDWVATLLTRLNDIDTTEEAIEFAEEMYEWAHEDGRRDAYVDIVGYAEFNVDKIDNIEVHEG